MTEKHDKRNLPAIVESTGALNLHDSRLLSRGIELLTSSQWKSIPVYRVIPTISSLFILSSDWDSAYEGNEGWEVHRHVNVYEFGWDGLFVRKHKFQLHELSLRGQQRVTRRRGAHLKVVGDSVYFSEHFWVDEVKFTIAVYYLFDLITDEPLGLWSNSDFVNQHRSSGLPPVPMIRGVPNRWITRGGFADLIPFLPADWAGHRLETNVDTHQLNRVKLGDLLDSLAKNHAHITDPAQDIEVKSALHFQDITVTISLSTHFRDDRSFYYDFQHGETLESDAAIWIRESRYSRTLNHIDLVDEPGHTTSYLLPDPNDLMEKGLLVVRDDSGNLVEFDGGLYPCIQTFPDIFPAYTYRLVDAHGERILVELQIRLNSLYGSPPSQRLIFEISGGQLSLAGQLQGRIDEWRNLISSKGLDAPLLRHWNPAKNTIRRYDNSRLRAIQDKKVISTGTLYTDSQGGDQSLDVIVVNDFSNASIWGFIPQVPEQISPSLCRQPSE